MRRIEPTSSASTTTTWPPRGSGAQATPRTWPWNSASGLLTEGVPLPPRPSPQEGGRLDGEFDERAVLDHHVHVVPLPVPGDTLEDLTALGRIGDLPRRRWKIRMDTSLEVQS